MAKLYSMVTLADGSRDDACLFYSNVVVNSTKEMRAFSSEVKRHVDGAKVEWLEQPLATTATDPQLPDVVNEALMALDDLFLSLRTGTLEPYDSWDEVKSHVADTTQLIVKYWRAQ